MRSFPRRLLRVVTASTPLIHLLIILLIIRRILLSFPEILLNIAILIFKYGQHDRIPFPMLLLSSLLLLPLQGILIVLIYGLI